MDANTLLADPTAIEIEKFVSRDDSILIVAKTIQLSARCPQCDEPSSSLKTRYLRKIDDLPWHNVSVSLELLTRKFRCRNELCPRKVFCERLPNLVEPFARRTVRLANAVEFLAFALGGRGAARTTRKLSFPVGKDVCLRAMRRYYTNSVTGNNTISVLGVDDFAFRRGVNYGTILVNLETRRPVDLLPDRTSETLKAWLVQHPEIEIVSRDRSLVYAEAVRSSAPQARQVADRWHLLKNLGDLVERFFINNHCLLTEAAVRVRAGHSAAQAEAELSFDKEAIETSNNPKPIPVRRQKLFDAIKRLQASGKTIRAIARELKVARNTVRRYVYCEDVPRHHAGAGRRSTVLPFADYLQERWRTGEHNGFRLWREIKAQGFSGEIDAVQRFVREWRKTDVSKTSCPISARGLAPRHVAKLLLNPEFAKSDSERLYLKTLRSLNPKVASIERLGSGFQQMVKGKRAELFDDWLEAVKASEIIELQSWANGLLSDEAAVRNALSSTWSNGQTEGQVNRLKTIKRQMYGRAKFDLLRARVLHQA